MMALITLPSKFGFTRINKWGLMRASNTLRSRYTASRQAIVYPYAAWSIDADLIDYPEPEASSIRAFLTELEGQANTFDLPVPGYAGPRSGYVQGLNYPVIANHNNTSVTNMGGNTYRIQKISGVSGAWDASATSAIGFSGDFSLRIDPNGGVNGKVGVSINPNANDGFGLDFGWAWFGSWQGYQASGAVTGGLPGATAWLWRTDTTLSLGRGASLAEAQAAPDYSWTPDINAAADDILYFDSSFNTIGDRLDVQFSGITYITLTAAALVRAASIVTDMSANALQAGDYFSINNELKLVTSTVGGTINFKPPLRAAAIIGTTIEVMKPKCRMAADDDDVGLFGIAPPVKHSFKLKASEAF